MRGQNVSGGILLTYPAWNVGLVVPRALLVLLPTCSGEVLGLGAAGGEPRRPDPRFRLPRSMGAGVARRFGPRWTASAALTHDQWTDTLLDRVPGVDGAGELLRQRAARAVHHPRHRSR